MYHPCADHVQRWCGAGFELFCRWFIYWVFGFQRYCSNLVIMNGSGDISVDCNHLFMPVQPLIIHKPRSALTATPTCCITLLVLERSIVSPCGCTSNLCFYSFSNSYMKIAVACSSSNPVSIIDLTLRLCKQPLIFSISTI